MIDVAVFRLVGAHGQNHLAKARVRRQFPIPYGNFRGRDIFIEPQRMIAASANAADLGFVAHGMGMISHEAPRLSDHAPQRYRGHDADLPLQAGMVVSIETTLAHPRRGFIKLEDTVAVTEAGCVSYGDGGRGWNRAGGR